MVPAFMLRVEGERVLRFITKFVFGYDHQKKKEKKEEERR